MKIFIILKILWKTFALTILFKNFQLLKIVGIKNTNFLLTNLVSQLVKSKRTCVDVAEHTNNSCSGIGDISLGIRFGSPLFDTFFDFFFAKRATIVLTTEIKRQLISANFKTN